MLNRRSIDAVAAAGNSAGEIRPLYDSYCFSRIPGTLESVLTGEPNARTLPADALGALGDRPDTVVLLFIDAFGWRFFEELADRTPALQRFLRDGTVSKLTAAFPSTTAAHVACLHSGLTPAESGIYEWYQYEPAAGMVIAPLLSSPAGEKGRNRIDLAPETLFDGETLHQRLAARGVRSISVTPAEFTPSPFNDAFTRGAENVPWKKLSRGLDRLADLAVSRGAPESRLIHYYYGGLDRTAHRSGPRSPAVRRAVRRFFGALESRFFQALERGRGRGGRTGGSRNAGRRPGAGRGSFAERGGPAPAGEGPKTCVVLTADHGMMAHDPKRAVYLNQVLPEVEDWLERGPGGRPKVPAGSPRDFFLHLREECFDEAVTAIRDALTGTATVRPVRELVAAGYFGDAPPVRRFLDRVGNAVILPCPGRTVWWYEAERFECRHRGDHGGLSPEEMEIPFGVLPI